MASFIEGIDVSSNQGAIDWNAASPGQLSFCFVRATVGAQTIDSAFSANWNGVQDAGLIRGPYHFFWPLADPKQQADNFIQTVGALQSGDLSPALDLEEAFPKGSPQQDVWTEISAAQRLPMIQDWLNRVEQALGVTPIIYTRRSFVQDLLGDDVQALAGYPLWVAHYTDAPQPSFPATWKSWTFWQYSDTNAVAGVTGKVDGDRFYGTVDQLKALTKS